MSELSAKSVSFTSKWGMIMVLIGMSIGPAAYWRFPRMVGAYGGGTYVICLLVGALMWAIPLLIAEGVIGKGSRFGVVGAFRAFLGRKNNWVSVWIVISVLMMTSYFNVIGAWCLKYMIMAISGTFSGNLDGVALFHDFTANSVEVVVLHAVMILITAAVLYKGVVNGIERVSKIMMPLLLVFTLVCVVWALTLPGGIEGLDFLFAIQPEYFANGETWLQAFTQIAWATGAGWGLILTYSVYSKNEYSPGTNAITTVFAGAAAGIIAAMAVIPTVFATTTDEATRMEIFNSGNQGLTFMVMPELFAQMPLGNVIGTLFFLALIFAFLSCQFACQEFMVRILEDMGWKRKKAIIFSAALIFLVGIPSAISVSFLNNQDWAWGIGLMLTAVFLSWAILRNNVEKLRTKIANTVKENNITIGKWWNYQMWLIPVFFVILVGWQWYQSIKMFPDSWFDPFGEMTVGTMLFQWVVALIIALILKKQFNEKTKIVPPIIEEDPSLIVYIKEPHVADYDKDGK